MAPATTLTASRHEISFCGFAKAARFLCVDGKRYVFKGPPPITRANISEHVVGRLGRAMGAPCPEVFYGRVPDDIRDETPGDELRSPDDLARFKGVLCHATECIEGVNISGLKHPRPHFDVPENRLRYAHLAVLCSWVGARGHEFLYEALPPHRIYSHDHGAFLPSGHFWTATIAATHLATDRDAFFIPMRLTWKELSAPLSALGSLSRELIEEIVMGALVPEWGANEFDLRCLAACLLARRHDLLRRRHELFKAQPKSSFQ